MAYKNSSSFRDPAGFVFHRDGRVFRQINQVFRQEYEAVEASGLYRKLIEMGQLIPHEDSHEPAPQPETAFKIIEAQPVPFVSYPYEWCFSQLKDAALLTLSIQQRALAHDCTLRDASAYNIQFVDGRPVLIDTLSFQPYELGKPWEAYRQFCQHFLAPLALMMYRDVRLNKLLIQFIDGIPLDLATSLLPAKTRWSLGLGIHLHAHARNQRKFANSGTKRMPRKASGRGVSRRGLMGILDSLQSCIRKLSWTPSGTEWGDYYEETNYQDEGIEKKKDMVRAAVKRCAPCAVWDLGANTGAFSRLAADENCLTVAFDIDYAAVEKNYRQVRERKESHLLPLIQDMTNPSPAIGWANEERKTVIDRSTPDLTLALALIHHLAISNNLPLERCSKYLAGFSPHLLIEFIPKEDSQVVRLLRTRKDIFPNYTLEGFKAAFAPHFIIRKEIMVPQSTRILFLMERKST